MIPGIALSVNATVLVGEALPLGAVMIAVKVTPVLTDEDDWEEPSDMEADAAFTVWVRELLLPLKFGSVVAGALP